jgi:uncharacterized surface protein with fasciclin (FAS1) repeats
MKSTLIHTLVLVVMMACTTQKAEHQATMVPDEVAGGQSNVMDDESQRNVVQVAVASPDHKTLVAALKAADYVDALSNAGPFTVFAPTDEAFGKLPKGTVETLVKPANKLQLQDILEYHVYVGVIRESMIQNGMSLNQVNGKNVKITKEGGDTFVNGAKVLGVVTSSNGIIYVIDQVLLPPEN